MKIAVLPGDGIGPEIVAQAAHVLEALRKEGLKIELEYAHIGGAGYDAAGDPLPDATLKLAQESDAVLLGAVGGYQYDTLPRPQRPEQGLLRIRKALELFANLRPAMVYPELVNASSLKPELVSGLDIMIVRELTGDIYFGQPRGIRTASERRAPGLRHHALQRIGNPPCRACRLPDRDEARQKAVLGGQGQRARHQHVLARDRDRGGQGVSAGRAVATCTWTTRRCSWCARPSNST